MVGIFLSQPVHNHVSRNNLHEGVRTSDREWTGIGPGIVPEGEQIVIGSDSLPGIIVVYNISNSKCISLTTGR